MKKVIRFWSVLFLDILGISLMVAALLTGWLPGPGGVPLFILGLSLLAINHDWAKRYINILRGYADRLGDYIFVKDSRFELAYDVVAPLLVTLGAIFLLKHSELWMISLGIFSFFLGLTIFLGNRGRWVKLKQLLKQKH